jgi:hypothetical protein
MASTLLRVKPLCKNGSSLITKSFAKPKLMQKTSFHTSNTMEIKSKIKTPITHRNATSMIPFRSFSTPMAKPTSDQRYKIQNHNINSCSKSETKDEPTQKVAPKKRFITLGRATLLFVLGTGGIIALYIYLEERDLGAPPLAPGQKRPKVVIDYIMISIILIFRLCWEVDGEHYLL